MDEGWGRRGWEGYGGGWLARWRRLAQLYVMETKRKAKTDRGDKLHSVDACMCVCVCMRRPLIKPLVRLLVSVCEPYLCLRVSHLCAGG